MAPANTVPSDAIVDKLSKLLAHEESARALGSIEEAEAFAGKIQSLLTRHKLTMNDVAYAKQEKDDPIAGNYVKASSVGLDDKKSRSDWLENIAQVTAQICYCRMIVIRYSNAVVFVGRTSDTRNAKKLYAMLATTARKLSGKAMDEEKKSEEYQYLQKNLGIGAAAEHSRTFRTSWFLGYVHAIITRADTIKAQVLASLPAGEQEHGLVLQKKDELAIDDYMNKMSGLGSVHSKQPKDFNLSAFAQGQQAGSQVPLGVHAGELSA
jgi:hypothetical protein